MPIGKGFTLLNRDGQPQTGNLPPPATTGLGRLVLTRQAEDLNRRSQSDAQAAEAIDPVVQPNPQKGGN